jgi:predicted transcriptional regulator
MRSIESAGAQYGTIELSSERKAQLLDYAARQGKDITAALDEVLAAWFEEECRDYAQAVDGTHEGYADLRAGRVQSAESVFEDIRIRHSLPH